MPTRGEKKSAGLVFRNLEEMLRNGAPFGRAQLDVLRRFLDEGGFSPAYSRRLKELRCVSQEIEQKLRSPVAYSGVVQRSPVKVFFSGAVDILRAYGTREERRINIRWRFDYLGFIKEVSAELVPEGSRHLLLSAGAQSGAGSFGCACSEMPGRMCLLNDGFVFLRRPVQYCSLVRYGHSTARSIVRADAVGAAFKLEDGFVQLKSIEHDSVAVSVLSRVGNLMPDFFMDEKSMAGLLRYS